VVCARSSAGLRARPACVGGSKGLSSEDKDKLKPYVLDAPPADIPHKLDVNFENKVHLIGYKFEPETAKPGSEVKLTYYWRCDDTLDDGWLLFTHTTTTERQDRTTSTSNGPLRESEQPPVLGPTAGRRAKSTSTSRPTRCPTG
jgi:hypothetical protein